MQNPNELENRMVLEEQNELKKQNALDYYKLVVGQLNHQDNLVHTRVGWPIAAEGFLFTAFAIVRKDPCYFPAHLADTIMCVGLLTSFVLLVTIGAGIVAWFSWRRLAAGHAKTAEVEEAVTLQRRAWRILLGFSGPICLSFGILCLWVAVACFA